MPGAALNILNTHIDLQVKDVGAVIFILHRNSSEWPKVLALLHLPSVPPPYPQPQSVIFAPRIHPYFLEELNASFSFPHLHCPSLWV